VDLLLAMQVFRRVVELRGFSAAARDLRMSNAAVSKQIAALEERLRTRLLHRTTRRVSPTAAGTAYYERCLRILEDVDEAERALAQAGAAPTGTLRVNAPATFGTLHLSPLVPEMLARWPELTLDLSFSDRFVDLVEEGVDVVVRIASELPDSATLIAQRLARVRVVLCAAPSYLAKHGTPRRPADLVKHECVVYSLGRSPGEWTLTARDGTAEVVRVTGRLVAGNSLVIRDAVVAGAGITLLPRFYIVDELRRGTLRPVLESHAPPPVYVHAVYPRARHLSQKVRLFAELLRERFAKAPWAEREPRG
jgi:DNA-binding transcriptional LysR family regulator